MSQTDATILIYPAVATDSISVEVAGHFILYISRRSDRNVSNYQLLLQIKYIIVPEVAAS